MTRLQHWISLARAPTNPPPDSRGLSDLPPAAAGTRFAATTTKATTIAKSSTAAAGRVFGSATRSQSPSLWISLFVPGCRGRNKEQLLFPFRLSGTVLLLSFYFSCQLRLLLKSPPSLPWRLRMPAQTSETFLAQPKNSEISLLEVFLARNSLRWFPVFRLIWPIKYVNCEL